MMNSFANLVFIGCLSTIGLNYSYYTMPQASKLASKHGEIINNKHPNRGVKTGGNN
jgi:hypothetical protein